jgi:hypothetical protein
MVSESGQLYTIEGFAAALIMILAAIFVFGATTVYAAGDEHITDMQLEQIANDALMVMDTPRSLSSSSHLAEYIQNNNKTGFHSEFMTLIKSTTGVATVPLSDLQYNATVYYRKSSGEVGNFTFDKSADYGSEGGRDHAAREPSIRASRWVYINDFSTTPFSSETLFPGLRDNEPQLVLLEVLVWRG